MITRCFDYRIINKMVPWQPVISSKIIYLVDEGAGLWTLHKYLDGLMIHVDMNPSSFGKKGVESCKRAFKWLLDNDYKIIYAGIPAEKNRVCHFANSAGMKYTHAENGKRFYKKILGV